MASTGPCGASFGEAGPFMVAGEWGAAGVRRPEDGEIADSPQPVAVECPPSASQGRLSDMSSAWHPGQCMVVGFEGTAVPDDLSTQIRNGQVGGVILFARNIESPEQVRALIDALNGLAPADAPLIIGVDQEGGKVQRMRAPWTEWPPMRTFGDAGDLELSTQMGRALARELVREGFNLNFAPCVDVDSNPENPVIGDRSFGADSATVGAHAVAMIEGMQAGGVAGCAKHFPGHGDTDMDSHLDLPRLAHGFDRLRRVELPPFVAAAKAGVASMMTAHVLFSAIDDKRPATMSPDVLHLVRAEVGFTGLLFTDDLEMGAVAKHFSVQDRTEGPLRAGVDVLLACKQADLRAEMISRLERLPDTLVESAVTRVRDFKAKWVRAPGALIMDPHALDGPSWERHEALATRAREGAASRTPPAPDA